MFQDFQRPKIPNCEFLENKNQIKCFHQIMKQKAFLFLNESIGTQQINSHTKAKQNPTHMKLKLAIPMSGIWSLQCSLLCCKETEKPYLLYIHLALVLNQLSLLHTCSFPWWLPHGPGSSNITELSLVVA